MDIEKTIKSLSFDVMASTASKNWPKVPFEGVPEGLESSYFMCQGLFAPQF